MQSLTQLLSLLLASMGLTILIVWPEGGPGAWFRDRILRRLLPAAAAQALDCYVCLSFWAGLLLSAIWWHFTGEFWCWAGCLMTPTLCWMVFVNASEGRK